MLFLAAAVVGVIGAAMLCRSDKLDGGLTAFVCILTVLLIGIAGAGALQIQKELLTERFIKEGRAMYEVNPTTGETTLTLTDSTLVNTWELIK